MKVLEGLKPGEKGNNRVVAMDRSVPNNFSRQPRMQNFPYNSQWKDGKPILPNKQDRPDGRIPNPLQRNFVNVTDDVPWCAACQSPHSLDYCVVALNMSDNQEHDEQYDKDGCGMASSLAWDEVGSTDEEEEEFDDHGCGVVKGEELVSLRRPSNEEIAQITTDMITQAKSNYNLRSRTV